MKAGDGALTRGLEPCPVTGCAPLASRTATLVLVDRHVLGWKPRLHPHAAYEYEAGLRARLELWHQSATRRTSHHQPPSGWTNRRARDRCPLGGRLPGRLQTNDQSPVPALPGCAITLPFSDLAIACVVRRGHFSCIFQHYRACEMQDNSCVLLQIMEFSRI